MTRVTRRALLPLAEDGLGGMPSRVVEVKREIAPDERFRRGTAHARPEEGHSVHVDVRGLLPGREYFYRFSAEGHLSRVGRLRGEPRSRRRVKYFDNRRGYVRTRFTAREVRTDFRALDHVQRPGAPVATKASFVVEDRGPGLNRV